MRVPTAITAALLLGLTGCRVIVVGDSNSCMGFVPLQCDERLWPGILQRRLDDARSLWFVENRGMPGMAAGAVQLSDGTEKLQPGRNEPLSASFHLERLLRDDDLAGLCRFLPFAALAPRLVIAVGTNDVFVRPSWQVLEDLARLATRVTDVAPCVQVYVATIPPRFDASFEKVLHGNMHRILLNGLIRGHFPADRVIDFDTGFTRDDFSSDGVHLNEGGQAKRAEAALRTLFPGLAS